MTNGLPRTANKGFARVATLLAVLSLAGCGGVDGIELNGKLFEAVGVTSALGGKREEPRTQPRAPLVLPPASQSLPEPGQAVAAAPPADPAWPNDPDKTKAEREQATKQAQAEFCRNANWKEKAMGDEIGAAQGPAGSCGSSAISALSKALFGD